MKCPHCGQDHPNQARFCPTTGKTIEQKQYCPNCGQQTEADWRVCGFCGQPIGRGRGGKKINIPRWAIWSGGGLLVLAAIVFIVAVVFNLPGRLTGRYDAVAEKMPGTTDMYMGINLLEVVQTQDTEQLGLIGIPLMLLFEDEMEDISGLSGSGEAGLDIQESINNFLYEEFGMNLEDDIIPWAGQYAGIAFDVEVSDQLADFDPGEKIIIAMEARSSSKADDFLEKLSLNLQDLQRMDIIEREYEGVQIYSDRDQTLSFARIGRLVAFSPSDQTLRGLIDDIEDDKTLGKDPIYRRLARQAPSGSLARVIIPNDTLASFISGEDVGVSEAVLQLLSSPVSGASQGTLISVTTSKDNLKFDTLTALDADQINNEDIDLIDRANDLFSRLPEDALIVFSGYDLRRTWQQLSLAEDLDNSDYEEIGFNPTRDLFGNLDREWISCGFVSREGWFYNSGIPLGVMFVARTDQTEELEQTIQKFNRTYGENDVLIEETPFQNGTLYNVIQTIGSQSMSFLSYGVTDKYLVFGTHPEPIHNLFEKGQKLEDTPEYRQFSSEISRGLNPTFYLDVQALLQLLQQEQDFMPMDLEDAEPYIQSIATIGAARGMERDDIMHSQLIFNTEP